MAMSKKCFVFTMAVIVAAVVAAIVFVAIKMQSFTENENVEDKSKEEETQTTENYGLSKRKALRMCEAVLNGSEPSFGKYNDPAMFDGILGSSSISTRVLQSTTGDTYQKSSYWLTGDKGADREALSMIRVDACRSKTPVIVIAMRPKAGIRLSGNARLWNHYKPESLIETWEEYDKKLNGYLKHLAPIPAVIILEPDLLMSTFDKSNMQFGWLNDKYKEQFYHRAQRVIKVLGRSWVYADAGNSAYLSVRSNMETMAKSLLRLEGLRGFAINTGHFFNSSFTNVMARRLHCLTGLHYITDTSRNGGSFSRQSVRAIEKCFFDPPSMLAGLPPGWSWGTKLTPRQKRWSPDYAPPNPPSPPQRQPQNNGGNMVPMRQPPNQQQNPEEYNQWINQMRNSGSNMQNPPGFSQQGSIPHSQPNNHQPSNPANENMGSYYNDMMAPTGKVPISVITAPPKISTRDVHLRSVQDALAIFQKKSMQRYRCLRKEAVAVHDANVWIKTPGESDGRLFQYGTHHKCLLGHTKVCTEVCRLVVNPSQLHASCRCNQNSEINVFQQNRQPTQPANNFNRDSFQQNQETENDQETDIDIFSMGGTQILYSANTIEPETPVSPNGPLSLEDLLRQGR